MIPEDIDSPTFEIAVDVMIGVDVYLSRLIPNSDRKL
jgi:hypothetical protein